MSRAAEAGGDVGGGDGGELSKKMCRRCFSYFAAYNCFMVLFENLQY